MSRETSDELKRGRPENKVRRTEERELVTCSAAWNLHGVSFAAATNEL